MKYKMLLIFLLAAIVLSAPAMSATYIGTVVDAVTGHPIVEALVTLKDRVVQTDAQGRFQIDGKGDLLGIRAYGYGRAWIDTSALQDEPPVRVKLSSIKPKALYLSFFGIGSRALREPALHLMKSSELNAVVIDVKGDRGLIAYKSAIPLATQVGAQKIITIKDLEALVRSLHNQGIYAIARIVVFKDNPLAQARADLAVWTRNGKLWRDREQLAWADPFKREVWEYNIEVAVEAAQAGFDEIQFDYVRFPDARGLVLSMPNTEENRVRAINGFLREARTRLAPYNIFLTADVFGYVCWNLDDTDIGQRLEELMLHLDYLSPMLYPSGFKYGIPGYRNPVAYPYEIVHLSLKRAWERTTLPPIRFRPWLQAFRDYAFDRRAFTGKEIRAQIKAAEDFGSDGWMLWNPRNRYSDAGLRE
jgi:hypothetical protein